MSIFYKFMLANLHSKIGMPDRISWDLMALWKFILKTNMKPNSEVSFSDAADLKRDVYVLKKKTLYKHMLFNIASNYLIKS